MVTIPDGIGGIDAAWVRSELGLAVDEVRTEQIGVGIGVSSTVLRLHLTGDDVPASLVTKLAAQDEAAVFTSSVLRMYEREVRFFDELAEHSPIRVPRGYGGAVSDDGASYVLVMEDMGGHRAVDQNEGMDLADAEQAVDELAAFHAAFWADASRFVDTGAAVALDDPIYPAILPMVYGEGWDKVTAQMTIVPTLEQVGPRWVEVFTDLLIRMSATPTTICHGDYRADNIFFDSDGSVVLLDFQLTGVGTGAYDLAYFVTQSLDPDVASANETALFDRYVAGLIGAGVPEQDTDSLWDRYRDAALFCLVYPVVASRGMDLTDERQYQLIDNMNHRFARALDELQLADLLPS